MDTITFRRHHLEQTDSTNRYIRSLPLPTHPHEMLVVDTDYQTDGRGESGGWESAPRENLLFTIACAPTFLPPTAQFALSEMMAVSLYDTLSRYAHPIRIKWPNDIYIERGKVCGILIEHNLLGNRLGHTLIGVGLNVNQSRFIGDAPNPVSLAQWTGCHFDREHLLDRELLPRFGAEFLRFRQEIRTQGEEKWTLDKSPLHQRFLKALYRNDGKAHTYADTEGKFTAVLEGVEGSGLLRLKRPDGLHRYAFKEVRFLPDPPQEKSL